MLWVRKQAGGCLGSWEPLEICGDVRLGVRGLGYVGSALLDEWLGMSEPLFDLAFAGVELCFYSQEIVVRADGEGHLW